MINLFAALSISFLGFFPLQEVLYSKTETFALTGTSCKVYRTSFWGDNGTPNNVKDDRFLGKDEVLDCGEHSSTQVPEDLNRLQFLNDSTCAIVPGAKLISYEVYQANVAKKKEELSKASSTVIPVERDVKPIRVRDIKQD